MPPEAKKIPKIIDPKTIKVIQHKGARVRDPIRFPKIQEPIEKSFTDSYLQMMDGMVKMMQMEMVKQLKKNE